MKVAGSPAVLTLLSLFDATPLPALIDILSPPPAPTSARLERGFMSEGRWFPCLSDSTTPLRHYFPSRSHRYHSLLRLHLPVLAGRGVSCVKVAVFPAGPILLRRYDLIDTTLPTACTYQCSLDEGFHE